MAGRKKDKEKTLAVANKTDVKLHPALENLKEVLMGPRLKAPTTISTYLNTGERFLSMYPDKQPPTDSDIRRYFIKRREQGISETTLRKEFFVLKKLALANKWDWSFGRDDTPYPEEEVHAPVLQPNEVEQLIKARALLSKTERFYLAVATTWIVRREELARIKKRDYDDSAFLVHTAKHGRKTKHLIPDCLKPIFADYRPKEHSPDALSLIYKRICSKAGLPHEKGAGWHSIRRTLTTILAVRLPQNNLDPALIADYAGWSRKSMGGFFGGAVMVGLYRRPEILDTDPYGADRVIYGIHPFLHLWENNPY